MYYFLQRTIKILNVQNSSKSSILLIILKMIAKGLFVQFFHLKFKNLLA
jgi:hypothetical protein